MAHRGVACCDGTRVAPSVPHVQAAGAWKKSGWLEIQGARADR